MARKHPVSVAIYRRHIQLFRYVNDVWIFTRLTRPQLKTRAKELRESPSKAKRRYPVPKRGRKIESRRRDNDIGQLYSAQYDRGIFETNIVSIISRVEAFIQDCVSIAVRDQPKKLALLSEKGGIPLDLFLEHEKREDILESVVLHRCQDLMFGKPKEYLAKAFKILSIEVEDKIINSYIELKASRDVIIHNNGRINQIYVEKAGELARGGFGDELGIDEKYFAEVIMVAKELSGAIQREIEKTYK